MAADVNGLIAGAIPTFGSPTLEGLEFEPSSQPGVLQMKSVGRQFVRFRWENVYNPSKAKRESGDGPLDPTKGMEKKLFVRIVTPGDKTEYDGIAEDYHKRAYARQYAAFREGKIGPEGQSVEDCEFIFPTEATELKHMGVHTLEQLADASDTLCETLPRGFEIREHARAWSKSKHGNILVDTTKRLAVENAELRTRQEKTDKELSELKAAMRALRDAQTETLLAEPETKGRKTK